MTVLRRWATFNLVGVLGVLVQLGTLFYLNRVLPGHYLWTTLLALELTLLHNFCWHRRLTWRDRLHRVPVPWQFTRFQLSSGLVSLVGNLGLMYGLVRFAHLPVLLSNGLVILCCSMANFLLGDRWAFRKPQHGASRGPFARPGTGSI